LRELMKSDAAEETAASDAPAQAEPGDESDDG
jgi:hypothetical protein